MTNVFVRLPDNRQDVSGDRCSLCEQRLAKGTSADALMQRLHARERLVRVQASVDAASKLPNAAPSATPASEQPQHGFAPLTERDDVPTRAPRRGHRSAPAGLVDALDQLLRLTANHPYQDFIALSKDVEAMAKLREAQIALSQLQRALSRK